MSKIVKNKNSQFIVMEKVIIIGGGAAGIYSALYLLSKVPCVSIEIIEKESKLGKKLRATGNGHANILNAVLNEENYNTSNRKYFDILSNFNVSDCLDQLLKWGVPTTKVGNLYYPLSFNAPSFVNEITKKLIDRGVKVSLDTKVLGYHHEEDKIIVETSSGNRECDDLIITTGGTSSPKLGSDGSLFGILKDKGYKLSSLESGLTPIRTKERIIKPLVGVRHKALVTLTDGYGPVLYSENGEYLYKKDGLSGICIMNISSKIKWLGVRRPLIHIDLFPNKDVHEYVSENHENEAVLESSLYSEVLYQSKARGISFNEALHDLVYSYVDGYGFEDSQVTIGGICEASVNSDLSSTIEKHVYFAGEILNFDGLCGGFNLTWALVSAMVVARSLGAN